MTVRVLADLRSPVLLLDSRSVLVSATCLEGGRHPFLRTYGTNLPNSLTSVAPDRPWLSPPRIPVSVLGTDTTLAFSRVPGWLTLRYLTVRPLPAITASTGFDDSTGREPSVSDPETSAFTVWWHRNINLLPCFDSLELRRVLGPANPRLISIAEEPLSVWPSGFAPD